MRHITPLVLKFTDKSANFSTEFLDMSAFEEVEVFIEYTNLTVGASPSITVVAQETPPQRSGLPDGTTVDVPTSKIVEGAYPPARSTEGLDSFTLQHIGMWMRLSFTLTDITSVDITVTIIGKT